MSTPLPFPAVTPLSSPRRAFHWPAWSREPLLHFVLLGGLLFGVDHVLASRADDPRVIVMGAGADAEARQTFKAARGREPNAEELAALRQVWLDNEVLYREGRAMAVDEGDSAIRERVIFKALSVVDANVKLPPLDDAVLHRWFEAHRAKYDDPARYDFQEAVLAGESSESAVRSFVAELNAGAPGDARAGLRVFKGRPRQNLVESYGVEFADALARQPAGHWAAQHTRDGWRAVRLDAATPARPADFAAVRAAVQQDWTDATLSEQRSAAVRALTRKYTVKVEGPAA